MDYFKKLDLRGAVLVIAIMLISACSSSKVDSGDTPETAAAATDAPADGALPPPAEASTDPAPPSPDAAATDPNAGSGISENPALATAPAPGSLDPSANPPPVSDLPPSPEAPEATAAPVADAPVASEPVASSAPVSGEMTPYKVKHGDTLMKIAFQKYGDLYRWKEILNANRDKIKGPNDLAPGITLQLPGSDMVTIEQNGERYLIKKGDTLGLISNDVYGTKAKWKKLWENNRQLIKNPNKIYAGFNLYYVPEAHLTKEKPAEAPSASNQSAPLKAPAQAEPARVPASKK
ncbi:MAG: LysM peptidoglycan-binding domain-containing protein [Proteobacteria bacterium]|nr:LysM peptidoglycan-binding domain-containing protein [Pseudomonadota bacterium]